MSCLSRPLPSLPPGFRRGALDAETAGFDGIELHAANGYLIDQFLQDSTNHCSDRYGGSIENRARFLLEITDAVVGVWGADRVGVHLRPRGEEHDMGDSNPRELFGHVAEQLGARGVAFLFVREIEAEDSRLAHMRERFGGPVIAKEEMGPDDGARLIGTPDSIQLYREGEAVSNFAAHLPPPDSDLALVAL